MPRHAFKFPPEVSAAVKQHVQTAIDGVDPRRYQQEAPYTTALVSKLEGVAYDGVHGKVVFEATVFDDRGRNSAESRYGADLAITATISDGVTSITKAILVQAKLGVVDSLNAAGTNTLKEQIDKMKQIVSAPKVMEIPQQGNTRSPAMISGNKFLEGGAYTSMALPDYVTARILTTLDGCTKPEVVESVKDSSLSQLNVVAELAVSE